MALAVAGAMVQWGNASAGTTTEMFDTQDDWSAWPPAYSGATFATSPISYTNSTTNGAGNATNPNGTASIGAGSLEVTLSNSGNFEIGEIESYNPGYDQNFLNVWDPNGVAGTSTAAYSGTAFMIYTVPTGASIFQVGLQLQYPGDGYYDPIYSSSVSPLSVVDGQTWYEATIPYTMSAGGVGGFGYGILIKSAGSLSGSTFYVDSISVGTPTVITPNNATWTAGGTGNWSTSASDSNNWVGGDPPAGSSSNATFDDGSDTAHVNVNVEEAFGVNNLTFNNPHGFSLNGSQITVSGDLTSTAGANSINTLNLAFAGTGNIPVSISVGSSVSIANFTHNQYTEMDLSGGGTMNVGTLTADGNIDCSGGSAFNITGNGTVVSVNQSVDLYDIGVATANDSFNMGQNNVLDNNSLSGAGTITIGTGSTLNSAEFNGFTFAGNLAGSGSINFGNQTGYSNNADAGYNADFYGTSPSFTGAIDAEWGTTLTFETGASLGSGTMTLDSGSIVANGTTSLPNNIVIEDTQGLVNNTTTINVTSGNSLTLSGQISGGNTLQQVGTGTLILAASNSYTGGTNVTAGQLIATHSGALPGALSISSGASVQLAHSSGGQTLSSLTIAANATMDITNNHVIINYTGGSPKSTILGYLVTGSNGGAWNGTSGIISSTAATNPNYGVGYSDGADGIDSSLTSGEIEVAYVQYGDITLSGLVNAQDFSILTHNFGHVVTGGWEQGDFSYTGTVNAQDFSLLAANFGKTETGEDLSMPASDWAAIDSFAAANGLEAPAVPEPTTFAILGGAALLTFTRRRRRLA